jgi:hypothetical protein
MARFAKLPSPPSVAGTVPLVVWRGVQLIQSCSCRSIVNRSRHRVTQRFTFHWSRSRSVPRVAGTSEPSHGDCTQWLAHFDSFRSNAFSFGLRLASGWTVAATNNRQPELANRAMATARNGRDHWIPPVRTPLLRHAFGFRLDSRRTVTEDERRDFANRAMATALNGRDHWIPPVRMPLLRHAFGFRLDSRRYLLSGGPLGSKEILQDSAALRFPDTGSNQAGVV